MYALMVEQLAVHITRVGKTHLDGQIHRAGKGLPFSKVQIVHNVLAFLDVLWFRDRRECLLGPVAERDPDTCPIFGVFGRALAQIDDQRSLMK
jgi:hypothetical protein